MVMFILKVKKMLTSFAFSKPAGKYILSYTLKNILNYIQQEILVAARIS
jgi:hypothetical protein